jgi:uncharacterized protein involved in oxidation of intracellular sulfur
LIWITGAQRVEASFYVMKTVIILNDAPYGNERTYNGLRLAHSLHKHDPEGELMVFLMADAVTAAKAGQSVPAGFYNIEHMISRVVSSGGRVVLCGSCMNARGLIDDELISGAVRGSMDNLGKATLAADKVIVF